MQPVTSRTLIMQFVEALGLPSHGLVSFRLKTETQEVVRIEAEYFVTPAQGEAITKILRRYQLIEP